VLGLSAALWANPVDATTARPGDLHAIVNPSNPAIKSGSGALEPPAATSQDSGPGAADAAAGPQPASAAHPTLTNESRKDAAAAQREAEQAQRDASKQQRQTERAAAAAAKHKGG